MGSCTCVGHVNDIGQCFGDVACNLIYYLNFNSIYFLQSYL